MFCFSRQTERHGRRGHQDVEERYHVSCGLPEGGRDHAQDAPQEAGEPPRRVLRRRAHMDHHGTDGQRVPAGLPAQGRDATDRQVPHVGQNGNTGEKGRLSFWTNRILSVRFERISLFCLFV